MASGIYCGLRSDSSGRSATPMIYEADMHGLLIGATGCGKTSSWVIGNLLGDNLNGGSQAVIDPKGEVAAVTALKRARHGEVRIIDPFGELKRLASKFPREMAELIKRGLVESSGFNPLASLDPAEDSFIDDCSAISEGLIKVEGKDPHWAESAQGLTTGLIIWEKLRCGHHANLANVRVMLTEPETSKTVKLDDKEAIELTSGLRYHVQEIIKGAARAVEAERKGDYLPCSVAVYETAASLVARFKEPTNETRSIISTADTQTRWLLSLPMRADLAKPGGDFRDLAKKPICTYIILPSARLRTHATWLRLVIVTALRRLYVPGGIRTNIIIDEMPALGYLPPLVDAYGLVRGYNIGITGIAQDLNQLKAIYKEHWESFIANAGYTICWAPNDLTTAEWMSRRGGTQTEIVPSVGSSQSGEGDPNDTTSSYNESYQKRPRQLPQELIEMQKGKAALYLAGIGNAVFTQLPHYTISHVKAAASFNPYGRR